MGTPLSQKYLQILSSSDEKAAEPSEGSVPVKSIQQSNVNVVHTTTLMVGDKNYAVTLDTGSSDTWLATTGFKCVNRASKSPIAESRCKLGPPYSKSATFSRTP